jgi:hypothetical protein
MHKTQAPTIMSNIDTSTFNSIFCFTTICDTVHRA